MSASKILVIYTGGTIGMVKDHQTGSLIPLNFEDFYTHVPELNRIDAELEYVSFDTPIDSSNMNPSCWKRMADVIVKNYESYDGFVVLHGSDTMAYSASALSFMLQGLNKPVIFTGSQLPIGIIRTDGKENLITAIEIASDKIEGKPTVQEVGVYFEYSLYRGNRSTKISANRFEAFMSPNYPVLVEAGVYLDYNFDAILKNGNKNLEVHTDFSEDVAVIKLFPGIKWELYKSIFDSARAVVLESFGSGNTPENSEFMEFLKNYIQEGGIVVNTTQCLSGGVELGKYEASNAVKNIGVVSAGDMTTEAVVTKLMYLLGKTNNKEEIIEKFQLNICGELTIEKNSR